MADLQTDQCNLPDIARRIRAQLVKMSHDARAPHLGSALSCVDLLVAAYWSFLDIDPTRPENPPRDRFILSKGHAAAALYATLAERGFFSTELLDTYGADGSCLPEQMSPHCVPGVESATGSLGHGLSLGLGMALAGRIQGQKYRVLVVVSDGECNEGSVWEAAMMAAAQQVRNLTVMIDFNRWQATGRSEDVLSISPLREKWSAFGWDAVEIDGHDIAAISAALDQADDSPRPSAIVCRTIKGKGVTFMEDDNNWHYRIPSDEELEAALREL